MTDKELVDMGEAEIKRLAAQKFQLSLGLTEVLAVVGNLQLALRHPLNLGTNADTARVIVDVLIASVEKVSPDLATLMRLGDDKNFDAENRT